jgi:hypothetical protein
MGGEKDRRRKFRREGVGKIEIDIGTTQVSAFLGPDLVDLSVGYHLPAGCLLDVRQGHEPGRQQPPLADLVGAHAREHVPRFARRQLDADAALHRFAAARHHDAGDWVVGQIVAVIEHRLLVLHDPRFFRLVVRLYDLERQSGQRPVCRARRQRIGESKERDRASHCCSDTQQHPRGHRHVPLLYRSQRANR